MDGKSTRAAKIFNRFSPFIKDYIYKNGWEELRDVQIETADLLFNSDRNLIVSSSTASGKTEAVLFPMLSLLCENEPSGVGILYIAPLKALINDQFARVEELLDEANISVFHWHGDISSTQKNKFLKSPKGILQITPESLESMLINRKSDLVRIFGDLRFIIIDEVHTLIGSDRGNQVRCLIERLAQTIGHCPRITGLSATISNAGDEYTNWLGGKCAMVNIKDSKIKWGLALEHFYIDQMPDISEGEYIPIDLGYEYIYDAAIKKKSIIFSNSREETEFVTSTMRQIADRRGDCDIFHIHHGNLSASIRESAEHALRYGEKNSVTCSTATLELGIDIGRLDRIVNVGSPNSVSSFLQRIGRSGRRNLPSEMIMVFRSEKPLPNAPIYEIIPWELIRAIAIIQLYIEERFIEPANIKKLPYSLLFHQTLSILASSGEMTPARLASKVLSLSAFKDVSKEAYKELLIHLIKTEILEQTDEKTLIVGLRGERIINRFKFYAVFKDSEDYTVRCDSEEIGTISSPPPVGDRFALAGRVWEVSELDLQSKLIFVKPVAGKMEISWPGDYGEIHTRIVERMRQVLLEDKIYPYLKDNAKECLQIARSTARRTGMLEYGIIPIGGIKYALFPWLGTRSIRTLKRFLQFKCADALNLSSIEYDSYYYITFKMEGKTAKEFCDYLQNYNEPIDTSELVSKNEIPIFEKYDSYIPGELLRNSFCTDKLDTSEIIIRMKNRFLPKQPIT